MVTTVHDSTIWYKYFDKALTGIWKLTHLRDSYHQSPEMVVEWWLVQYLQPAIEIVHMYIKFIYHLRPVKNLTSHINTYISSSFPMIGVP